MMLSLYFGRCDEDKQHKDNPNSGLAHQYPANILKHYKQLGIIQGFDNISQNSWDLHKHTGLISLLGKMIERNYDPQDYPSDNILAIYLDDSVGFDLPLEKREDLVRASLDVLGYQQFHWEEE